jgi:very-short-patch-repair endonuclease
MNTVQNARRLRRVMSLPEVLLWQALRRKQGGIKLRRQHPIGPYVLDFWCPAARLALEVDGRAHDMGKRPEHDARRDAWLAQQGIAVLRIAAPAVLRDPAAIAEAIARHCQASLRSSLSRSDGEVAARRADKQARAFQVAPCSLAASTSQPWNFTRPGWSRQSGRRTR